MSIGLTNAQSNAFDFIRRFMMEQSKSPTVEEIRQGLGYQSRGRVHAILKALQERGRIDWKAFRPRSIVLVTPIAGAITLRPDMQAQLARHCETTGDRPDDVVNDALALHFDALAGATHAAEEALQ